MKRFLTPLTLLLVIFGIFAVGLFWWKQNVKAPSGDPSQKNFLIPKGTSASIIGERLYKEGFIHSPLAFKIYVQITGSSEKIPAGEYRLTANLSLPELVGELLRGPAEIWVTIPEGLRREEIVERYIQAFGLEGAEAENFRSEFLSLTNNEEGYLFPDTYLFPRTASASIIFKKMLEVFDTRIDASLKDSISESGYSLRQIIILAAIIERETKTDEERPIVAGILLKRLKADWPLQTDASLQYAVASENCKLKIENCKWWPTLTEEDLNVNSPYNTYKFVGLPPTPIASPGTSSIKAVVYPQDSPYWFYIHDSGGQIHFAKTLDEHNSNIRTYLGK